MSKQALIVNINPQSKIRKELAELIMKHMPKCELTYDGHRKTCFSTKGVDSTMRNKIRNRLRTLKQDACKAFKDAATE